MAFNYNEWSIAGSQYCYWLQVGSNGYAYGTSGSGMANGADSSAGRLKGLQSFNIAVPEAPRVNIPGDNGVVTQFQLQPQELPSGTATFGVFNQTFNTVAGGTQIEAIGDYDMSQGIPQCWSFARLGMIINSPALIQDAGAVDTQGWQVTILNNLTVVPSDSINTQTATAGTFPYTISTKRASNHLWGVAYSAVTNGTTSAVYDTFSSPYPVTMHTFIGDGSDVTVVLSETPSGANGSAVKVWKDGTLLSYTTDYTVNTSTKTVTFGTAPTASSKVVILYQHLATC